MRDYGQVQCSWWGHPDSNKLSDSSKLLFLYLLTGPHSNGLGCYRLPFGYVSSDTGNPIETISKGFIELEGNGFSYHCKATDFVVIPKYLKWNQISNGKVAMAREKEFNDIPSKFQFIHMVAGDIREFGKHFSIPFLNRIETLLGSRSETLSKQEPNLTEPNLPVPREGLCTLNLATGEIVQ